MNSLLAIPALAVLSIGTTGEAQALRTFESASGVQWSRHSFIDAIGAEQTYYLSAGPAEAPVVLLIQGSGCVPVFASVAGRKHVATASQDLLARVAAPDARVMVVEKPGLSFNGEVGPTPGLSEGCSLHFRRRYALDDWTAVLQQALAVASPRGRLAVLGISEGGTAAAQLTERGFSGPVGVVSGGSCFAAGTLLQRAYVREREGRPGTGVDETVRLLSEISADPNAIERFAWGQTYRRWSTFGAACNVRILDRHLAPLFIAYGTADEGLDIAAFEHLAQFRRDNGRPVLVHRVRGGDHDLSAGGIDNRGATFRAFISYVLPSS